MKHFGELLFFLFIAFLIWVFIGGTPDQRIHRVCSPISWVGNFVGSVAIAADTDYGRSIKNGTANLDYRCQLTIWDYFYAAKWEKEHPGVPLPGAQNAQKGS
ncbi:MULTISPECIES: hypothetical protein [Acidithiobacillus]|uniref:Uncharacterized protein n=2 Tax=Acidithiobacillus TaxID=119977 RepID=A0A179BDB5_ACIFR|nr:MULTISPECIES: hypothetical protein [Acidithiobacillus]MBU2852510.1 hypothetical protein [Acidithiobacillus ferriphilus]MEB8473651.1 hypothetical protein [Acidithiobacillus ferriphilus]MEB8487336.1 hypothetical protein [Acidithiobacillus ferriphilus]MEB8489885.1 hypothetical protein [Acidithiobacillus ferriphilus]MEB8492008.1 hypothetical protein [Acidithiobacillus ferriphilus]